MTADGTLKRSIFISIISIMLVIFIIIVLVINYPPIMIIGLDAVAIAGFILIPLAAGKAWRYEIDRIGRIMRDIENHLEQFQKLDERQQEEYEQYHILKSTAQSIKILEETPGRLTKIQKKQLRYLKSQDRKNKFKLAKRGFIWTIQSIHPKRPKAHPSVFKNIHTIFTNDQFQSMRHLLIAWIGVSVIIIYLALTK